MLFLEKEKYNLKNFQVFIVDTVGILAKIYSYADVAYVGGGYTKTGVHNVLEPTTFGIPILIGPNYYEFIEAIDLVKNKSCFTVNNSRKLYVLLAEFFRENKKRNKTGSSALDYVKDNAITTHKL